MDSGLFYVYEYILLKYSFDFWALFNAVAYVVYLR